MAALPGTVRQCREKACAAATMPGTSWSRRPVSSRPPLPRRRRPLPRPQRCGAEHCVHAGEGSTPACVQQSVLWCREGDLRRPGLRACLPAPRPLCTLELCPSPFRFFLLTAIAPLPVYLSRASLSLGAVGRTTMACPRTRSSASALGCAASWTATPSPCSSAAQKWTASSSRAGRCW